MRTLQIVASSLISLYGFSLMGHAVNLYEKKDQTNASWVMAIGVVLFVACGAWAIRTARGSKSK